jgi:HEAT repeat protein
MLAQRPPPRILALLIAGVVALLVWGTGAPGPRVPQPPPPPLDEAAALAAFRSGEAERVRAALARVREARPPPVDWLVASLRDPDRGVREWSAHALGDLAPQDARVVDALLVAFEDPDDYVRWKAARALGLIGAPAARAIPVLEQAATAKIDVIVNATAVRALEQIRAAVASSSP